MKGKTKKIIFALIIVIALVISFFAGKIVGELSGKLARIEKMIELLFPLEYDEELIEDWAAKAMVMALNDPYSEYMTKEENALFDEYLSGEYKGIGLAMIYDAETDKIMVTDVTEGGPADLAGVKAGDELLYVDEIEFSYENYDKAYYYIKGISEDSPDDDTEMKLGVLRGEETLEFFLKRQEIILDMVTASETDGILYIELESFNDASALEFKEEMEKHKDAKGIILDLRDNGGGELDSLIEVAELLLPEGIVRMTENAVGGKIKYNVEDDEYCDVPLVVLVNEETASAAEVLAAAIKERDRGILVGKTTYGKGLVQMMLPVGDGSVLKLTIEKYYTAGGNYINEIGVEPDIEAEADKQLEAATEYIKSKIA